MSRGRRYVRSGTGHMCDYCGHAVSETKSVTVGNKKYHKNGLCERVRKPIQMTYVGA